MSDPPNRGHPSLDDPCRSCEHRLRDREAQLFRGLQVETRVGAQVAEILALRGLDGTSRFRHEGEFWTIAFEGSAFRLRDSKGLHYIADLRREPGRERHVLDLVAAHSDADTARPVASDAGPILDPTAKAQYRARLDELAEDLHDAERLNDPVRTARAEQERQALLDQLAAAVGLGGRDRKASSDASALAST